LLTGIFFCASSGGATTFAPAGAVRGERIATTLARPEPGRVAQDAIDFLRSTLLAPERIESLMAPLLTHREDWMDRRRQHVVELRVRANEAERKLRNLYEAVEKGTRASVDRMLRERIA
jgi:hypothetical protein